MSAPKTDIQKEARRHWGPLVGMGAVVLLVLAALLWWLAHEAANGDRPDGQNNTQPYVPATETVRPSAQPSNP